MSITRGVFLLGLVAAPIFGQLTLDQKMSDFQAVAGLYAKQYGPYQWKVDALHYDLLNIQPWLDQIAATKNDLDFYEVMSKYVASLNDAHDSYSLPANFVANLNFTVDIYDGKLLVDSINRSRLPVAEFQFLNGHELVSIDGQDAQKLLDGLMQYEIAANPRSTRRLAAALLTTRPQVRMPHAADVPEISTVVFREPDGTLSTYRIPWTKSGLLLTSVGRYTTPHAALGGDVGADDDQSTAPDAPAPAPSPDSYMQVLRQLWNCRLPDKAVNGFGAQTPIFSPSLLPGFEQRLGKTSSDFFFSGVFAANGHKIGFIRIPNYEPADEVAALTAFATEIAYFQANTDGLVIDEMRNPGGDVAFVNAIVSYLIPTPWDSIPFEVRANSGWVVDVSSAYESAKAQGAPQVILDLLQQLKDAITTANSQMRGMTVPIPLDDFTITRAPATDSKGNVVAYTRPLIVLVDELSASGADYFPATIQDNQRGPLVGWRTMGAGGSVTGWEAGTYSLGTTTVTQSLMHRKTLVVTSDYPSTHYVENVGVRPEIQVDYMTYDNLVQSGRPFVNAFISAIVGQIEKGK